MTLLKERFLKGPNYFHPEKPSAVGSRNSTFRGGRNEYQESGLLVDEEVGKILNHVAAKLPPEILSKLDVQAGLKSKLHNYYNQTFQNMLNRYIVTVEDELAKKYRDLVDKEEFVQLNQYTPRLISTLIDRLAEPGVFTTEGLEKSISSTYMNLQENIHRSFKSLEKKTNSLLLQKTDVGAFIASDKAYNLVKCSFKHNSEKPKTVVDVKMGVNVLDAELINPIYHYQKPLQDLLKEVISRHIHEQIDAKISLINQSLEKDEQPIMDGRQEMFERLKSLEAYLGFDEAEDANAKKYQFVSKQLMDALDATTFEIPTHQMDANNIRENVKSILDQEHVQSKGFNRVVSMLTTILDNYRLGYQYINNLKNARSCTITEYSPADKDERPDETFGIKLYYVDADQLRSMRKAYDHQMNELRREIETARVVVEKIHDTHMESAKIVTYKSLSGTYLGGGAVGKGAAAPKDAANELRPWNELVFTSSSRAKDKSPTGQEFVSLVKAQIQVMDAKVAEVFGSEHTHERFVVEERLNFLKRQVSIFTA